MTLALYRKYRPQSFSEVVGQNHIKTTIQSELETDKVAHAYLFSGPRGLGKTTTARLLAKSLNCLNRQPGESEPCNKCDSCLEMIEGRALDVIEIDAASHTGVDNVRENIINNSRFTPTSRKFKAFIIDEVHMLSTSAFNALLKTLEEPPAHAVFILATTEIHKVPQTIISRCQHFDFRRVSDNEIFERLKILSKKEHKKIDDNILENIAHHGQGSFRDSESLLGQILSLDDKEITAEQAELVMPTSKYDLGLQFIDLINKSDAKSAIELVNKLVSDGVDLERFNLDTILLLRKILLFKINPKLGQYAVSLNKNLESSITMLSTSITEEKLIMMIEIFSLKRLEFKISDIPQLPLEMAVLQIIGTNDSNNVSVSKDDDSDNQAARVEPTVKVTPEIESKKEEKSKMAKVELNINQFKEKWSEFLDVTKGHNQSLASAIRIGEPRINNGNFEIAFPHRFHQQRANETKNRQILEKVIEQVYGLIIPVHSVVDENLINVNNNEVDPAASNQIGSILDNFGGQLID
ncbi:MAG: DNA polymerase III subunit gamma/tau [Patescibacteria group bacterium]|nr:DNA polymerase III subunit gamma/tau [Patescibacteria group bacterium]